eukprot:CAMPEP_0206163114 /NCGR_PEP_ID=MMETSP1474-20131121/11216_1 /ASSEMBLY_ACC=CAM_ASM_001110 /TAXON_ID=97495 /ORGANISM="Imantonia sp., Strain RCC918" /LENGTH=35 /DNA_ID= /DNA_START= /DNA_END= /DNA_ORIENTATION=
MNTHHRPTTSDATHANPRQWRAHVRGRSELAPVCN